MQRKAAAWSSKSSSRPCSTCWERPRQQCGGARVQGAHDLRPGSEPVLPMPLVYWLLVKV